MKSARRRSRELVVQALYQWLITQGDVGAAQNLIQRRDRARRRIARAAHTVY